MAKRCDIDLRVESQLRRGCGHGADRRVGVGELRLGNEVGVAVVVGVGVARFDLCMANDMIRQQHAFEAQLFAALGQGDQVFRALVRKGLPELHDWRRALPMIALAALRSDSGASGR